LACFFNERGQATLPDLLYPTMVLSNDDSIQLLFLSTVWLCLITSFFAHSYSPTFYLSSLIYCRGLGLGLGVGVGVGSPGVGLGSGVGLPLGVGLGLGVGIGSGVGVGDGV
jgi:hypothetical protein